MTISPKLFAIVMGCLCVWAPLITAAQTDFYVGGNHISANKIHIEAGAKLYISGNLVDSTDLSSGDAIDSKIILSGTLELAGDIVVSKTKKSTLISFTPPEAKPDPAIYPDSTSFQPTVKLVGSGDQTISGDSVFLPRLVVNKTGGGVTLNTTLLNYEGILLQNGNINLNNREIKFLTAQYQYGNGGLEGENDNNQITGDGTIFMQKRSFAGGLEVEPAGLGLTFTTPSSGVTFSIERIHTLADFDLDLGARHINRYYKLIADGNKTISNLRVEYFEGQRNSVDVAESAIYTSIIDGSNYEWIPHPASASGGTVLKTTTMTGDVTLGETNHITVGNRYCVNDSLPSIIFERTITSGNSPATNVSGSRDSAFNVCEYSSLSLASLEKNYPTYIWTFGTDTLSQANALFTSREILSSDSGSYTLFVRNREGCENTSMAAVNVRKNPVSSFYVEEVQGKDKGRICTGYSLLFDADSSALTNYAALTNYFWDFGDSQTENTAAKTVSHTYTNEQLTYPKLIVTTEHDCRTLPDEADQLSVMVLDPPAFVNPAFTLASDTINAACEGLPLNFKTEADYRYDFGTEINQEGSLTCLWDFDDGESTLDPVYTRVIDEDTIYVSDTVNHIFTHRQDNLFNIRMTLSDVKNSYGCTTTITGPLHIYPAPGPSFRVVLDEDHSGPDVAGEICEAIYLYFENNPTLAGSDYFPGTMSEYFWRFGLDGDNSLAFDPVYQFIGDDTYNIRLRVTSSQGCVDSTDYALTVHPAPKGTDIEADQTIVCTGAPVSFTNGTTISGDGPIDYLWNFGDGNTSTDKGPVYAYSGSGQFPVTLTRTSEHNCTNNINLGNIKVKAFPTAIFEADNVCDELAVTFVNKSFIPDADSIAWLWDFGDGAISTTASPGHTYSITSFGSQPDSSFNVRLIAASFPGSAACQDTTTQEVTVYRRPGFTADPAVLTFQPDTTIVPSSDPDAFLPAGTSYQWSKAGVPVGASENYTITTDGNYSVLMTTPSPANCQASVSFPAYLLEAADLGGDQSVCEGGSLDATPAKAGTLTPQYQWYKGGAALTGPGSSLPVTESDLYKAEVTYVVLGVSRTTIDEANVTVSNGITVDLPDSYTACEGETVILDAGIPADNYSWSGPSGPLAQTTQTITVSKPGDYLVTVGSGACSDTDQTTVTINKAPTAAFITSSSSVCLGEEITFTAITNGTVGWDFGDGTQMSGTSSPVKTYSSAGTYQVTMEAASTEGCTSTYQQSVTVHEYPVAGFTFTDVCYAEAVGFTNTSTGPAGVFTWHWDFGDGKTSSAASPSHEFPAHGDYTVTLTASINGCETTVSHLVSVYEVPETGFGETVVTCGSSYELIAPASASYRWFDPADGTTLDTSRDYLVTADGSVGLEITTTNGCKAYDTTAVTLNSPVTIDLGADREVCGSVTIPETGSYPGATFEWSTGAATPTITVTESGFYQVDLTDQNGCTASDNVFITVAPTPSVNLGTDREACQGETVTLNAGAGPDSYSWSTGAATQTITVSTSGTYSVTVTEGDCPAADEVTVTVHDLPTADFAYQNTCLGDAVTFANSSVGTGSLTYAWSLGDGDQSPVRSPTHSYAAPGNYPVTLTVTDANGCSGDSSRVVEVYPNPKVNFTMSGHCAGEEIIFTNRTTMADGSTPDYTWYFGDGGVSDTSIQAAHTYTSADTYFVQLVAESAQGCVSSAVKPLEIRPTPVVDLGGLVLTCDDEYLLDAGNPGSSYAWQDNSTAQTFLAKESGTYAVKVTHANGCRKSDTVTIELLDSPEPDLGDDQEVCGGVTLYANTTGNYLWSTGDREASIEVTRSDEYWVLVVSDDLCERSDTAAVAVHAFPVFDLGADLEACEDGSLLIGTDTAGDYLWSTGAVTSHVTVSESGTYRLAVASGFGCVSEDSVTVTFHPLPVIGFEDTYQACNRLTLDAGADGQVYAWSNSADTRLIEITESGYFWAKVTSGQSCVSLDTTFVTILEGPEVDLGEDRELCFGETALLDAGAANTGYQVEWNTGAVGQTLAAGTSGTYAVQVTTPDGCQARDEVTIQIRESIVPDLGEDMIFCGGAGFELTTGLTGNFLTYVWGSDTGQGGDAPTLIPEQPGTYWVSVFDTEGCMGVDTIRLTETTEQLLASFLIPSKVGQGDYVRFVPLTGPAPESYFWDFGDGATSTSESPTYQYFVPGTYQVTLTVFNGVCSHSLTKDIEVRPAGARSIQAEGGEVFRLIEITSLEVYPNPVKETLTLGITLNHPSKAMVSIYDMKGLRVFSHEYPDLYESELDFDLTGLRDGMYLVFVRAGLEQKTSRFIKVSK